MSGGWPAKTTYRCSRPPSATVIRSRYDFRGGDCLNTANHRLVTHAALARLPPQYPLLPAQLDAVVLGNILSDANLGSSGVHCDNCAFGEGALRVANCWSAISSEKDRFSQKALKAFGGLLHTTQDFYAHSNWVELHRDRSPVPLWDQHPASLPAGIFSGTIDFEEPKHCGPGTPDHNHLNKDTDSSKQGGKTVSGGPNSGRSYFELAFEAAVEASGAQVERFVAGVECYRVVTRTGPSLFSGTDADVFIVLRGEEKDTGRLRLDNPPGNDFERGRTDSFLVGTAAGIGDLKKVTIGFEAEAGVFPGWYLEEVVVESMGGQPPKRFKCGRWLARNKGDGKTVVELSAE